MSCGDDALELWVSDSGPRDGPTGDGDGDAQLDSGGHGLIGMRERTRVYGGDLVAGPRAGGGFEVRARIPDEQSEVRAA